MNIHAVEFPVNQSRQAEGEFMCRWFIVLGKECVLNWIQAMLIVLLGFISLLYLLEDLFWLLGNTVFAPHRLFTAFN